MKSPLAIAKIHFARRLQEQAAKMGYQIRRLERGVHLDQALEEQLRLVGDNAKAIFEVGAADGRDSVTYATRCPNATVYAYEPLQATFKKLALAASGHPRIVAIEAAVASRAGSAEFHVTALPQASSLYAPIATGSTFDKYMEPRGSVQVPTVTLDGECSRLGVNQIDLLKMDAQGAELEILRGAETTLAARKVRVIYSEVNFMRLYDGACLYHEVASFLDGMGYDLHNFYDLHHNQFGRLGWADAIFVRR